MVVLRIFKEINQNTLIPIGLVISLFGFVSWITTLHNNTKANSETILEIKSKQRDYEQKLDTIIEKLGRIEGKLGIHGRDRRS